MGVKPTHATVTVASAGTRVQATASANYATSIYFEAAKANTGNIFVGLVTVSSTIYITCLAAGEGFALKVDGGLIHPGSPQGGNELQVNAYYVDSSVSGEKVQFTYMQRVGVA